MICVYACVTTSPQRVHFDLEIGYEAVDYNEVMSREKLNDLELRIRQLMDVSEGIKREQGFQRVSLFCQRLETQKAF